MFLSPNLNGGMDQMNRRINDSIIRECPNIRTFNLATHGPLFISILLYPIRLIYFATLLLFHRIDICHIHLAAKGSTWRKMGFSIVSRLLSVPFVIHLHGSQYREFFSKLPRPFASLVRSFFANASKIIVLGKIWENYVLNEIYVNNDEVVILPNAVIGPDKGNLGKKTYDPQHILFLGCLGDRKGTPELLSALASPKLANLSWNATLAGDGEVSKYRKLIKKLGLNNRVTLTGWIRQKEVSRLLERSTILALPSHAENLPLSMLEGMAHGLCPVITPVGAVKDVIRNGENGILVPIGDVDQLANSLAHLLENPDVCRKLAEAARIDFEKHYDFRHYHKKLSAIYTGVLSED